MPASNAEKSAVITDDRATELRNVVLEVDEVLTLLVCRHVVEVDVLVAPLEVVNDALVRQLLLDNEDVLEEVDDALLDVEVVELGNHRLLILQVLLILLSNLITMST